MVDPVMATDGHHYDRANIERWLAEKTRSPLTNEPLYSTDLTD